MNFSKRLKELMTQRGVDIKQLSTDTGIPLDSLKNYLYRGQEPRSKTMMTLEKYFGVSSAYLRGDEDALSPTVSVVHETTLNDNFPISEYEKTLLFAIRQLNQEEREMLDTFVGFLIQKGVQKSPSFPQNNETGTA